MQLGNVSSSRNTGVELSKEQSGYDAATYWEDRLRKRFDLAGVGHGSLGPQHNARMYRARQQTLALALQSVGRSLEGCRVLDVGCGSGFYTEYCLRSHVRQYVGLDIAQVSVEMLRRQYPQLRFMIGDISDKRLLPGSNFDIVLAADVLFHIVDDEAFSLALANIAVWLNPGGLLVLSDVFPRVTFQSAPHCRYRSRDDYLTLLHQNDLHVAHEEPIFALLQPPPYGGSAAPLWRAYAWLWRYGWRIARIPVVDRLLPRGLGWLDEAYFLRALGRGAPNSKWLLAVKGNVA